MDRAPKTSVIRSVMWAGAESGIGLIISMGSLLGIAKLIGVAEFGLGSLAHGLVMVMAVVGATLVHDAVVQRAELTPAHRVAAWWGAAGGGLILMLAAASVAPVFAAIYDDARVGWLMLTLAPMVLFDSLAGPILADRRRQMDFGSTARRMLAGRAIGMVVGLSTAWLGAGAWCIVWQQLATSFVSLALLLQLRTPLPDAPFRWQALLDLLRFTRHLIGTQLLLQAGERAFLAYVGYALSFTAAGYWSLASRLVETITGMAQGALYHVGLAHFSRLQKQLDALRREVDLWVRYLMLGTTVFVAAGLVMADQVVLLIMGETWLGAVPAMQLMLVGAILPLRRLFPAVAVTATGRPFIGIQCFLLETVIAMPLLFLGGFETVTSVAALRVFRNFVGYAVVAWVARARLGLGLRLDVLWLGANVLMIAAGIAIGLVARDLLRPLALHALAMMTIEGLVAATTTTITALLIQPRLVEQLTEQYRRLRGRSAVEPLEPTGQSATVAAASPEVEPDRSAGDERERSTEGSVVGAVARTLLLGLALAGSAMTSFAAEPPRELPPPRSCPGPDALEGPRIYVAPDGDDLAAGTHADPARDDGPKGTLFEAVETAIANGIKIVVVRGGDYFMTRTLDLDSRADDLVIVAASGERPVLHGGIDLSAAAWNVGRDGIYRTKIDAERLHRGILDLHVGEQRQVQARWPNARPGDRKDGWLLADTGTRGHETLIVRREDLPAVEARAKGSIHVYDQRQWASSNVRIAELDPRLRALKLLDNVAWHVLAPASRYYLFGSPSLLDVPGEWAWDEARSELAYMPGDRGFPKAAGPVVAATIDSLVRVRDAKRVTIAGLGLRDASPHGSDRGDGYWQRGGGAIRAVDVDGLLICDNQIDGVGVGISLIGVRDVVVSGNKIRSVTGNGIRIAGSGPFRGAERVQILDNQIDDTGLTFAETAGIFYTALTDAVIARNRIDNAANFGIYGGQAEQSGEDVTARVLIARNLVRRANSATADGAGIKLFSAVQRDSFATVIRDNWLDGTRHAMNRPDGTFYDEQDWRPALAPQPVVAGVYLDWIVSGVEITGNLVTRGWGGILLTNAADNRVAHNLVWGGVGSGLELSNWSHQVKGRGWKMRDNRFEGNLIVRTDSRSLAVRIYDTQSGGKAAEFEGNVYAVPPELQDHAFLVQPAGWLADRRTGVELATWSASRLAKSEHQVSDPGLRDPMKGDFRLAADSPVRALGLQELDGDLLAAVREAW